MADSYTLYNGDGVTTDFTVVKPYLSQDHVTVEVDDASVPITWLNSTTVRCTTAPASGTSNVKVKRTTPKTPQVTFADSAGLVLSDLNTIGKQNQYIAEEQNDAWNDGVLTNEGVSTSNLADDAVTNAKLADNSVDTEQLVADAVTTAKIADSNVTTAKIADDAVTTAKILDDNVTSAKIADDAVTTAKILDDNVTSAKIADDAVTTDKIADANVTQAKLEYPAGYTGYILLREEQTSGTDGGGSTSGSWIKRTLNTESVDTGNHASISSSVITLAAGTYRVKAASSFNQGGAKIRLRNTTDSTTTVSGLNGGSTGSSAVRGLATLQGRFTIAGTKNFELQYYVTTTKATDGLGTALNTGEVEVYSEIELIRE